MIEFEQVEGGWIEITKRRRRYQIVLRSNGDHDWYLIQGILATASGTTKTLESAKAACESNKAERAARRQQREAERDSQ